MKIRQDLLDDRSPQGIEVVQLTDQAGVDSCHIYMEAQVFTPDSKRLVLHQHAHPHGGDWRNPKHQYYLCDLDDNCKLSPLTDEPRVYAPSISPDGRYFYYFVNETDEPKRRLTLKRLQLDTAERETVVVLEGNLPGTHLRLYKEIYPLSTIRSDGNAIAISAFLGDGVRSNPDWGLLVFDLATGGVAMIVHGPSWCNVHPQYCRATDAQAMHDILIQENHGCVIDNQGEIQVLVSGLGADIHVIRDDGTDLRTMPWGRDGIEACQGHQCWRGQSRFAITSTVTNIAENVYEHRLIEAPAAIYTDHVGATTPGAQRNDLLRNFHTSVRFDHFGTDLKGDRLISDYHDGQGGIHVYLMKLGAAGKDAAQDILFQLDSKTIPPQHTDLAGRIHVHPFLSPDGTMGFFNSNESGTLQAYMIRHLPY